MHEDGVEPPSTVYTPPRPANAVQYDDLPDTLQNASSTKTDIDRAEL